MGKARITLNIVRTDIDMGSSSTLIKLAEEQLRLGLEPNKEDSVTLRGCGDDITMTIGSVNQVEQQTKMYVVPIVPI